MRRTSKPFAVCIDNRGQEASLIRGKIYRVRPDARARKDDLIRVIDESGEDYLFDAEQFVLVDFPLSVRRNILKLQRAS
jgi:hypothetical protein